MKTKIFVVAPVCVLLISCASQQVWMKGPLSDLKYVKQWAVPFGQQISTIDGVAYDQVWDACVQTFIKLGYAFYVADKEAGEIVVSRVYVYDVSASVTRTAEKIKVRVSLLGTHERDERIEPLRSYEKDEVDGIMARLRKELKIDDLATPRK